MRKQGADEGMTTLAALLLLGTILTAHAESVIRVESLQTRIAPDSAQYLAGIWCRNVGHVVHISIAIEWPQQSLEQIYPEPNLRASETGKWCDS